LIPLFRRWNGADLVIAGEGADRERLQQLAHGATNIRFLGRVDPVGLARLYRHAVALLAPSLCFETFGLTAVEGFACGTPAIVRDRGALPELIHASAAGFSYIDETELQTTVERLVQEPGLRDELGARGRDAYLTHWTLERHLERYFAIIEAIQASNSTN
jgi:glycosyltransferase involved in cell wall biosynthesis